MVTNSLKLSASMHFTSLQGNITSLFANMLEETFICELLILLFILYQIIYYNKNIHSQLSLYPKHDQQKIARI